MVSNMVGSRSWTLQTKGNNCFQGRWKTFLASAMRTRIALAASCVSLYDHWSHEMLTFYWLLLYVQYFLWCGNGKNMATGSTQTMSFCHLSCLEFCLWRTLQGEEIMTRNILWLCIRWDVCNSYITGARDVWHLLHRSTRVQNGLRAECNICHASWAHVIYMYLFYIPWAQLPWICTEH